MNWFVEQSMFFLRVLLATALGFCIGAERKIRSKEAGIRTHAIVSLGAAIMTLVGLYGFEGSDGARVAAQIVTGIGFLGAGIIMYRRDSLRGVTTAAGIWATAGVGMAAGAGMYLLAVLGGALVLALQLLLHIRFPLFRNRRYFIYRIRFDCVENENKIIKELFGVKSYSRINYYNTEIGVSAVAEISTSLTVSDDEIKAMIMQHEFITSIERIFQLEGDEDSY